MNDDVLYDDGKVILDAKGIILRHYYFPKATSKHIPYAQIHHVDVRPMGWLTGKLRLWGSTVPTYWLPLDTGRTKKDELIVLDIGHRVKPAFTPDDTVAVERIIREHMT